MDQSKTLSKALLQNSKNPKLAFHLFKRTLSSPLTTTNHLLPLNSISILTRILLRSNLLSDIDSLHHLLLPLPSPHSPAALYNLVKLLALSGNIKPAISQFQTIRTHFPNNPPSISLYNLLINHSIQHNYKDYIFFLYKDLIFSGVNPKVYTFNLLIKELCDQGRVDDARTLFDKMAEKGCRPNEFTSGILIRGYCKFGFGFKGLEFLDVIKKMGIKPNVVMYNTLIGYFCKEGETGEAERLVERMRVEVLVPNVVTFNSRISALCEGRKVLEASRIFRDMQVDEVLGLPKPNVVTFNLMLRGFCKEGMLEEAKMVIESMEKDGLFMNVESRNIWLSGLVRNGKLLEAKLVLDEMEVNGVQPNIYSYNIFIDGMCKNGMLSDARKLMGVMISSGVCPDSVTYSILLHGYCRKGKVNAAHNVLQEMTRCGCFPNSYTCNTLLHSLWKEGRLSEAEKLLQKMNERGYILDTVSCNIVVDGLCKSGKVEKAIEIVNEMWTHGKAALGNLENSFIGLVDNGNSGKKCLPDVITYTTIINALCKDGKLDEAKRKFVEMIGKNLYPDSLIYDTFMYNLCKRGKMSSAFQVLKDMEKKGCKKTLQTYNSLIIGFRAKNQIFEMTCLLAEMRDNGISPNACTYNNMISCLCEGGKTEEATSLLDDMLQKGIMPNLNSFKLLIKAFCQIGELTPAQEVFDISLSIFGHKDALYSLIFNELLARGEAIEAKKIFEAALDRCLYVGDFLYKDLLHNLCREENVESAFNILKKMLSVGYEFDPAAFMPVIDALGKRGLKHEADELAERMLEMASEGKVANKVCLNNKQFVKGGKSKDTVSDWKSIIHRDDGSALALRTLKRTQKGWGQGTVSSLQILDKGELQVAGKERESQFQSQFRDIATIVIQKTINPETQRPYTISMSERLIHDIHCSVDPNSSSKKQTLEVTRELQKQFPIKRPPMRLRLIVSEENMSSLLEKLNGWDANLVSRDESGIQLICEMDPGLIRDCDALMRSLQGKIEVLAVNVHVEGDTHVDNYDEPLKLDNKESSRLVDKLTNTLQNQTISTSGGGSRNSSTAQMQHMQRLRR